MRTLLLLTLAAGCLALGLFVLPLGWLVAFIPLSGAVTLGYGAGLLDQRDRDGKA